MELAAYLDRIGYAGVVRADLATLNALHRAHQFAVPFEDLDVLLRRPVGLDLAAQYDKIVRRRRGGWCYEMNGVMGWALREIGFDVMRVSGGVRREQVGDGQLGNHLALLVQLERTYFVDVGFGGTLIEPLPLQEITREDAPYHLALSRTADDHWRFTESVAGDPFSFDFRAAPADEALLAQRCAELQTDTESPFVQNLVVQRRTRHTHVGLRGRVLAVTRSSGVDKRVLSSAEELVETLATQFDLDVPEIANEWPGIVERHEQLFGINAP